MLPLRTVIFQSVALIAIFANFFSPANASSLPSFTSEQLQRITRDSTPTNSQDFFRRGQAQFEREVRLLQRWRESSPREILKIAPPLGNAQDRQTSEFFQKNRLYPDRRTNSRHQ
ncbi:MAG: hypothetical protein KME13_07155 [Myxacorys californica WJT36-NPBG1]|jgi:hypothetical protein|nr:hypothetical protein [Myxacorys californica WJT36-NPBG1]